MASQIYVVGHINPDTDSIAAAMGYAWLISERDGVNAVAARNGPLNPQTSWVLKHLKLDPPVLFTDASPRFETVTRRLDTTTADKPLRDAWTIASRTGGVAPVLNEDGTPYGLITGRSIFEYLSRLVGPRTSREDLMVSEILDQPCRDAVDMESPRFRCNTRIRDVLARILREEDDEFWVVDDESRYVGICRQRDLLNPPRVQLILVDHNEAQQSVASLEEAELIEILDHHRLGNPPTRAPIRFTVDVVGSTCTLVSERIEEAGLSAPPGLAGVMLAGLVADTLTLASPTTTVRDKEAATRLGRWAFVGGSPLMGETITSFGESVLSAGAGLGARSPNEIVGGDMKLYTAGGYDFLVSQVEVSDLREIADYIDELNAALSDVRERKGGDFAVLMVTGVVRGGSALLLSEPPPLLDDLPYPLQQNGTRLAEGVVSRKKQLLPTILSLLEA
jgi:manganese-dependent inorganic pyrophosphatase